MKNKRFLMKMVNFTTCAVLCLSMTMHAGATGLMEITESEETVSSGDITQDTSADEFSDRILDESSETADMPDVAGVTLEEAEDLLAEYGKVIVEYAYSDAADADVVMEQTAADGQIYLTVSLGAEPQEDLYTSSEKVDKLSSFGLSAYSNTPAIVIDGNFDDWADMPHSYEFNWDNSNACWYDGVWGGGLEGYKTPVGTYDDNVRHKVSLYVDGEYAYLYVKYAKYYGVTYIGADYRFYDSTGACAAFNLTGFGGETIVLGPGMYEPGVHEICVRHAAGAVSWSTVDGAKAYVKVNEDYLQTELEVKIPLSQMELQNSNMTREHMDTMQWDDPNLTYRKVTASGAGTAPFATAGIALICVPAAVMFLRKKGMKKQEKVQ